MHFPFRWKLVHKETGEKWKHPDKVSLSLTPDGSFVLVNCQDFYISAQFNPNFTRDYDLYIATAKNKYGDWAYYKIAKE